MTSLVSIACDSAENTPEMPPGSTVDKATLRRTLMACRNGISVEQRKLWDAVISDKVIAWWSAHPVETLGVYWPMQGEPDIRSAYAVLAERGVQLALPVVVDKDAALEYAAWTPGDTLVKDALGVSTPASIRFTPCPDALLIPCLGYNAENFRLGYGGGFYDRTLAEAPRPLAIGISYECGKAVFEVAPHDVGLDEIITES